MKPASISIQRILILCVTDAVITIVNYDKVGSGTVSANDALKTFNRLSEPLFTRYVCQTCIHTSGDSFNQCGLCPTDNNRVREGWEWNRNDNYDEWLTEKDE